MPRHNEAILVFSPSRIELARLADPTGRVESMPYDQGIWRDAVSSAYKPFDHWLGRAAGSLGLSKNTRITVYLTGTRLRTEVSIHTGSERTVSGIAHATMAEQFEQQDGLYQVAVSRLEGRPNADSNTAWYFISADADSFLDDIVGFVERAGFVCAGVSSVALAHAKSVSAALSSQKETRLVCDVGEHETIVAMGENRAIPLFRPFSVGVASFTDVYVRVLEQEHIEDVQQRAREYVFRHGVPGRDQVLDQSLNLTGRDVLPMLQPVIQRLAVEIKNTLRFGLEGRDTESLHVELAGLASAMPGLASALSVNLDFEITASPGPHTDQPVIPSLTESVIAVPADLNPLRPLRLTREMARSRFKTCTRLGCVAAAIALGVEAMLAFGDIRASTAELKTLEPRMTVVRDYNQQSGRAASLASELGAVRGVIDERVGNVARWAPALRVIAGAMQDNTRLVDCRGFHESGHAWYRLSGEVELRTAEDRTLGVFLDTLEHNDMIDLVELESARVENGAEGAIQRFVLRVRLITQPAAPESVVLAGPTEPADDAEGGIP